MAYEDAKNFLEKAIKDEELRTRLEGKEPDEAWSKVGITCNTDFLCANQYYFEGKNITREEAVEIAEKAMIKGPKIGFPVY